MLRAEGLARRFGKVVAVESVSFEAHDGQITGLLGPNGAGKTTSLRMIYGLVRPDAGRAWVDDLDPSAAPLEARRRLGVLPDSPGLYARLTGRENIRYFAELNNIPAGAALDAHIDALAQTLDLERVIDRPAAGYSQGERMKVAIARAIVHDPPNIVLDEPTNGLDVMSTRAMRDTIRALAAEGRCVLFTSHQMAEIGTLCDRLVIIGQGRVVAQGTIAEVLTRAGAANLEEAFVRLVGHAEGGAA
ncbi:ATP-binding cassette domain-containing protein [Myxococcota bacterium]|nr:ATP-binding cassette domain-containing protein [Myxococcota bacterium]